MEGFLRGDRPAIVMFVDGPFRHSVSTTHVIAGSIMEWHGGKGQRCPLGDARRSYGHGS